jgi:hypothetical protein
LAKRPKRAEKKWEELSPPEKMLEYATASGKVLGKAAGAGIFLTTGAEVFHLVPDLIDPARALDLFVGLGTYFGVPLVWNPKTDDSDV